MSPGLAPPHAGERPYEGGDVSHHLGKLRAAALVVSRREGKIVFASLTSSGRALLASLTEVTA